MIIFAFSILALLDFSAPLVCDNSSDEPDACSVLDIGREKPVRPERPERLTP